MEFNVSHQAGIVSLIAVVGGEGINVGTDVVCVNERIHNDHKHIERSGFFDWVDIHADVFAESEVSFMKLAPVELDEILGNEMRGYGKDATSRCQWRNRKVEIADGGGKNVLVDSNTIIDAKLRRFYAMWCLREAYVKMTGEALLAPWLKELEISEVKTPAVGDGVEPGSLQEGEISRNFRILFKENLVTNVKMELRALGTDYIIGGAVRLGDDGVDLPIGRWKELELGTDVLAFGEPMS